MKKLNLHNFSKRFAILAVMAVMAVGALVPATVFAASNQPTKCAATDVQCVITVGNTLIANRQTSLNTLSGKISADLAAHKITSAQASVLQSDVTTNQTGLSNLKSKLDAETSAAPARQDALNVVEQFRIYAVVLPRDYRRIEMDIEINAKTIMQGVAPTIQAAISKAPANEQAQLNALFSDYQKQVAAANAQLGTAQADFPAMTPENFNQNHASYESTRLALDNALRAARLDLQQAAKDLKEMANILGIKK